MQYIVYISYLGKLDIYALFNKKLPNFKSAVGELMDTQWKSNLKFNIIEQLNLVGV